MTDAAGGETKFLGAVAETVTGQNERTGSEAPGAGLENPCAEPMPAEVRGTPIPRPNSISFKTGAISYGRPWRCLRVEPGRRCYCLKRR